MSHNRIISVIGLGYVGLPVAVAFGLKGRVIGFDINRERIEQLKAGDDTTREVLSEVLAKSDIYLTTDPADLKAADFHIVTVPTPIDANNKPDLSPLVSASNTVGAHLKKGDVVVYESTVYPGVTEEECVPILEKKSGLVCGQDFTVGYSPERINPGDKEHRFETITKVVSGMDDVTLEIVAEVYESVVKAGVHRAPSIKAAEAAKVIENTQRDLNIALMNELSLIFDKMGIDTRDVLAAAGTKWNFLPFTPGLVGGHCIGVDPYYLTHKAEQIGYHPQVILSGRRVNDSMGAYIADKVMELMGGKANEKSVAVLGLTFKENVPDIRNTRVIDIIEKLNSKGVSVQVVDPAADVDEVKGEYSLALTKLEDVKQVDAVVVAVGHDTFVEGGWDMVQGLLRDAKGVCVDVRGILDQSNKPENIVLWRL